MSLTTLIHSLDARCSLFLIALDEIEHTIPTWEPGPFAPFRKLCLHAYLDIGRTCGDGRVVVVVVVGWPMHAVYYRSDL
jgi:hypothetical protein